MVAVSTLLVSLVAGCQDATQTLDSSAAVFADSGAADRVDLLASAERPPQNLIFLAVDTLRRDQIGRWDTSGRESATPFLDQLLSESLVLEDHRSCSNWTLSSLVCLFTGQGTIDLGFEPLSKDEHATDIPDTLDIAPRWLADAGSRTAAVSASPFLYEGHEQTTDGFESVRYETIGRHLYNTADWVREQGLEQLEALQETDVPWYLHLHFMDAHTPFDEHPDQWEEEGVSELRPGLFDVREVEEVQRMMNGWSDLDPLDQDIMLDHLDAYYRADLRFLDEQLALLWQSLEEEGALDDTLVVVWSDHGEQFFEHGAYGHNQSLHFAENQAMAAFWGRGLAAGSWWGATEHQDVFPSILRALGQEAPVPVTGSVVGTRDPDRPRLSLRYRSPGPVHMAVDLGDHRLAYDWNGDKALYDVRRDPLETTDLYDRDDPVVQALWAFLDPEIDRVQAYVPEEVPRGRGP